MFKDTVIVAIGTAVSRLTGLLRVIVLGVILGQTALADAYDGANNSPNSIYELLVGGVLAASLVPVFTRHAEDEDDEATSAVVTVSLIVLAFATVLAIAAAPLIFRIFSLNPSAAVDADQFRAVGTMMCRIFLIQIFFYGLTAVASALLNSRRRFFAAAWAPAIANIVTIMLLLLIPFTRDGTPGLSDVKVDGAFYWLLTLGATSGIAAMGLVLIPALKRANIQLTFKPEFRHPAVHTMARLSFWTFGYVVTNQVCLIVIKNLAQPGSGNQDAYSKAMTFFYLPHGLLAISIATTFVPELSRRVRNNDVDGFAGGMTAGFRWISLLTLPASLGMILLAEPILRIFLQHGHFTSEATYNTSRALIGLAVGLLGFSIYIFALRGFYAHHDTRTPFIVNLFENILNVAFAVWLVDEHGVLGLGLAFAFAYLLSSVVVLWLLHVKHRAVKWRALGTLLARCIVAVTIMSLAVTGVDRALKPTSGYSELAELFFCLVVGFVVYVGALFALRVPEIRQVSGLLPSRGSATPDAEISV